MTFEVVPMGMYFGRLTGSASIGSSLAGAITRKDGTPAAVRVLVRDQITGKAIGHIWSDEQGEWSFQSCNPARRYRAEITDPPDGLNGAVLDWLQPVPM